MKWSTREKRNGGTCQKEKMCEDEERKRDPLPLVYNKMKQKETQILYDDKNNFR